MSSGKSNKTIEVFLGNIPQQFRSKILREYLNVKSKYRKGDYEASGLSCGKFCEQVLRFLQNDLTGNYIGFSEEIRGFQAEVIKLEKLDKTKGCDSTRIIIPRALAFLYTLRNKRNIGHSGGDVEANQIDSSTIGKLSDWIMCELIRVYHDKTIEDAQQMVDFISTREVSLIWEINGKKRVLKRSATAKEKVMLLTYSCDEQGVFFEDLLSWVEYRNKANFKDKVLIPLHQDGFIEYDKELQMIFLSPTGVKFVEEKLLN